MYVNVINSHNLYLSKYANNLKKIILILYAVFFKFWHSLIKEIICSFKSKIENRFKGEQFDYHSM